MSPGIAEALRLQAACVLQRQRDGLAGDELLAHHAHRHVDALADQRLATLADQAAQGGTEAALAVGGDQLAGQQQAPGGRVDEQRGLLPRCGAQSPCEILSRISASRVSASGIRSSASARHISATPSCEDSAYSCSRPWTMPARPPRSCVRATGGRCAAPAPARHRPAHRAGGPAPAGTTASGSGLRQAAVMAARSGLALQGPSTNCWKAGLMVLVSESLEWRHHAEPGEKLITVFIDQVQIKFGP